LFLLWLPSRCQHDSELTAQFNSPNHNWCKLSNVSLARNAPICTSDFTQWVTVKSYVFILCVYNCNKQTLYKIAFISSECTTPFWWKARYPRLYGMQENIYSSWIQLHLYLSISGYCSAVSYVVWYVYFGSAQRFVRVVRRRHRRLPQLSCDTCDENNGFIKTADKCGCKYYSVVSTSFGATKYLSTKVLNCVLNMHFRDIFTCTQIHVNKCDHNVHRMWQTMREWLQRKEGSQMWYTVQTRLSYISRRKCELTVFFVVLDNLVIPSIWAFISTYVWVTFRQLNKTTTFREFIQQVYYYIL